MSGSRLPDDISAVEIYLRNLQARPEYRFTPISQAIFDNVMGQQHLDHNELLRPAIIRLHDPVTGRTLVGLGHFITLPTDNNDSLSDIDSDEEMAQEIVVPSKPPVENIKLTKAEQAFVDACELPDWMTDPVYYTAMTEAVCLIPSAQVVQDSTYLRIAAGNNQCPITRKVITDVVKDAFAQHLIKEYIKHIAALKAEINLTKVKKLTADFKARWEEQLAAISPDPVIVTTTGTTVKRSEVLPDSPSQVLSNFFAKAALDKLLNAIDLVGKCKAAVCRERLLAASSEASAAQALGFFATASVPVTNQVENVKSPRRKSI